MSEICFPSAPQNGLVDNFGRTIDYLRLSVTDRCDLRCSYCMPQGHSDYEAPANWLTFDEIERVVALFGQLGLRRLRLTGGEPLVRRDLATLAARLAQLPGIMDLSLSTNAVQLARQAEGLFRAGIRRLNISLDTLRADRFAAITGGGKLSKVLEGLAAAKAIGFAPVKINMVALRGVNDDEAEEMVDFCLQHQFTLRFIETMPMGSTGRAAQGCYMPLSEIRERLERRFQLVPSLMPGGGPARYVQIVGSTLKIGFITPISQHFCATCNRVRLSVEGRLHLCLGQDHSLSLREPLRSGARDDELLALIRQAIDLKPERHEFNEKPEQVLRFMSKTGG
jgi:GTP 3',8-cyclase